MPRAAPACLLAVLLLSAPAPTHGQIVGLSGPCLIRPPACFLNCPHGYSWGVGSSCLCLCYSSPCTNHICFNGQVCIVSNGFPHCVSTESLGFEVPRPAPAVDRHPVHVNVVGECPRLDGGSCTQECGSDADCPGTFKCCHNGCGTECVRAVQVAPVKSTLPIMPISRSRPAPSPPGNCAQLANAIKQLPGQSLRFGYTPACTSNNWFEPVQCDQRSCWCAEAGKGVEVLGSKVPLAERDQLDCGADNASINSALAACDTDCGGKAQQCSWGLQTDRRGCPKPECSCKDPCEGVKCNDKFSQCQLKEANCDHGPCLPIPTCLINPCIHGVKRLPSGVTALCKADKQCGSGFWCHHIGFDNLGFCCAEPESARRSGQCPNRPVRPRPSCESECRADSDCANHEKCCFDGCGLSCISVQTRNTVHSEVSLKEVISLNSQCPTEPVIGRSTICSAECETDGDCSSLKRCCVQGCSKACQVPAKASPCLQAAITAHLYRQAHRPSCALNGLYQPVQCNGRQCFCVNSRTGYRLPGTAVSMRDTPDCSNPRRCPPVSCTRTCEYGNVHDDNDCPTCRCENPCSEVACPVGNVCVMVEVRCMKPGKCPLQPRCVPNICQARPYVSAGGYIEQCQQKCPTSYSCVDIGLPGLGGLCCPIGINDGLSKFNGDQCPHVEVNIDPKVHCHIECTSQLTCGPGRRCCFQGCGMSCIDVLQFAATKKPNVVSTVVHTHTIKPKPVTKIGQCAASYLKVAECSPNEPNECNDDSECEGIKKCCYTGCSRKCAYAEVTTACLQKAAFSQMDGHPQRIKCSENGLFEPIQCDNDFCWCVDKMGEEMTGTRVESSLSPDCQHRKECPANVCHKKCQFGFVKDSNGCNACECLDPCLFLECEHQDKVCVLESVHCIDGPCPPILRCVPDVCHRRGLIDNGFKGVLTCQSDNDCLGKGTCVEYERGRKMCCVKKVPHKTLPRCPGLQSSEPSCQVKCVEDSNCPTSHCCSNGCGTECAKPEPRSTLSFGANPVRGTCPIVHKLGPNICGDQLADNKCSRDEECADGLICCFDGCARNCLEPEKATPCLQQKASHQGLHLIGNHHIQEVRCNSQGGFEKIQQYGSKRYCVGNDGLEVPGTRSSISDVNCAQPRPCPAVICPLPCDFGFALNEDGCQVCECRDPCHNVECPLDFVCRMLKSNCSEPALCPYVPSCVPNICPRGEPLNIGTSSKLLQCNDMQNQKCPPGWSCHMIGFGSAGYCCAGIVTAQPESQCAPVPVAFMEDQVRKRAVACKSFCGGGRACCFNGYGTSCGDLGTMAKSRSELQPIKPVQSQKPVSIASSHLGFCPANHFHNPGCQVECVKNLDCPEFQMCCDFGCGKRCVFPDKTHVCIHSLASAAEEMIKFSQMSRVLSSSDFDLSNVRCNEDGSFKRVQCDATLKQCWCVNENGVEVPGTRSADDERGKPDCGEPRSCHVNCADMLDRCEHGLRLDSNGCPQNNQCECLNPCEKFKCVVPGEICVLRKVECLQKTACPAQPTCRPHPCPPLLSVARDRRGVAQNCRNDHDCKGRSAECRALATTNDETGQRVGVCCSADVSSSHSITPSNSKGMCPPTLPNDSAACKTECASNDDCSIGLLCCTYGCRSLCISSVPSTTCNHLQSALLALAAPGVTLRTPIPLCDPTNGLFSRTQCDEFGTCWCVDPYNGIELTGTRSQQPTHDVCRQERQTCAIQCSLEEVNNCLFGLDLNSEGCPRTSQCKCRNPCNSVECAPGQICLLRSSPCEGEVCLPTPSCEPVPCDRQMHPLRDVNGVGQLGCFDNFTRPCPRSYHCTAYDQTGLGVCCPDTSNSKHFLKQPADDSVCPHGTPFVHNDELMVCSAVQSNSCPTTHYCVASVGQNRGLCCPSKRFVCNLELDIGSCNQPVTRFYFDAENAMCQPFVYGGCGGNQNNFASEHKCRLFCNGLLMDADDALQYYHVGFAFTGPLKRTRHTDEFSSALRDFLNKAFEIEQNGLRDLLVQDDNSVRFNLVGSESQTKADQIVKAIETGQVYFRFGNETYHAEPTTLFSRLVDTQSAALNQKGFVFWLLLISSCIVALVTILLLFCACTYVRRKSGHACSAVGSVSPSPYGQISAFLPPPSVSNSQASSRAPSRADTRHPQHHQHQQHHHQQQHQQQQKPEHRARAVEVDNNEMEPAAVLTNYPKPMPISGLQTHGGRRPTRTTLYY